MRPRRIVLPVLDIMSDCTGFMISFILERPTILKVSTEMKPQMNTEQPGRNQRKSHHENAKKSFAILRVFVVNRMSALPGKTSALSAVVRKNRSAGVSPASEPRQLLLGQHDLLPAGSRRYIFSHDQRLCGEVRSSGFSLLRAQVSLEAEISTWDNEFVGSCFLVAAPLPRKIGGHGFSISCTSPPLRDPVS